MIIRGANMNASGFNRFAFLCLLAGGMLLLGAERGSAQEKTDALVFGSPLKNDIVFFYRYTETVREWFLDKDGEVQDSSERALTYFIGQRQLNSDLGGGAKVIEANIDSMHLDYRGRAGDVVFNTQNLSNAQDMELVRHPAILVPSSIVNCVTRITLSAYGTLVNMSSQSIENLRRQGEDPMLDDYTQKGIEYIVKPEYLSTVLFPWRNAVPLGRIVPFGESTKVAMTSTVDRVVFHDTATVVLEHSDEAGVAGVLDFKAPLSNPSTEWVTFEGDENPVLVSDAEGFVSGKLMVDRDGQVLQGWSMANGTIKGSARGKAVNVRVQHQVSVELLDQKSFPGN